MHSFSENLPRTNHTMYGWLHETSASSETKSFYTARWGKWFEFKQTTRREPSLIWYVQIFTNVPRSFQSTCVGLSDFYLMTLTVARKSLEKYQPKAISYRSYKKFSNVKYRVTLINNVQENFINNDDGFQRFCRVSLDALNKHAPHKKKHAWRNQMPFFNKDLSKAIMTRTKLRKFSYETGLRKIKYLIQNKEIFVSLF